MDLKAVIGSVPNFPKPGILFYDITTLVAHFEAFSFAVEEVAAEWSGEVDVVAAIDARGFIFGSPIALSLGKPLTLVRKKGKLPPPTVSLTYSLEYGSDTIEIKEDAIAPSARVLIVDDLLATGGTANAARELIEKMGGVVAGFAFVIELASLCGRAKLGAYPAQSLVVYSEGA